MQIRIAVLLLPLIMSPLGAHAKVDNTDACVQALVQGTYVSDRPTVLMDLLQIARQSKVRYLLLTMEMREFKARLNGNRHVVPGATVIPIFDDLVGTPVPELMATSYLRGPRGELTPPGQWRVGFLFDADLLLRFDTKVEPAFDQREQELFDKLEMVRRRNHDADYSWIEHENRELLEVFEVMTHTRRARALPIHFMHDLDLRVAKALWIPKPAQEELALPMQDLLIGLGMSPRTPVLELHEQVPPMAFFGREVK